jgi:hypothetical protein
MLAKRSSLAVRKPRRKSWPAKNIPLKYHVKRGGWSACDQMGLTAIFPSQMTDGSKRCFRMYEFGWRKAFLSPHDKLSRGT